MKTLSSQEITQVSGAFNTDKIIEMGVKGFIVGTMVTGFATLAPASFVPACIATAAAAKASFLFGSYQFLVELTH